MSQIVEDFRGRKVVLIKNRGYKRNGSCYVTRNSVAKILLGEKKRVRGGSTHPNAVHSWYAWATKTRLRIGCHIFTGNNFKTIQQWALGTI